MKKISKETWEQQIECPDIPYEDFEDCECEELGALVVKLIYDKVKALKPKEIRLAEKYFKKREEKK